MKEYWIEHIIGKLYAVKWHDGNYSITSYEGTYDECATWINNK